jgi:hypothetical protein
MLSQGVFHTDDHRLIASETHPCPLHRQTVADGLQNTQPRENRCGMSSIANARTVLIYAPFVGSGGVRRFVLRLLSAWLETADPAAWRFRVLSQPVDGNGDELPWPPAIFTPVSGDLIRQNLGAPLCDFLQTNQNAF